ncbi:hypothetical protein ACRB90_004713 [Escherichia coli]
MIDGDVMGVTVPSAIILGGEVSGGVLVPGMLVIGGKVNHSPVDLLQPELDPRIRFACASEHAYYAESGKICFAAPDEWPLEFRDGVAVGRHEPEPERTNYTLYTRTPGNMRRAVSGGTFSFSDVDKASDGVLPSARFTFDTPQASNYSLTGGRKESRGFDGEVTYSCFVQAEQGDIMTFYADGSDYLALTVTSDNERKIMRMTGTVDTLRYCWLGLRGISGRLVAILSGCQSEHGSTATSPILTDNTPVTRAVASVTLDTQGASGCRIHFSNGDTEEHRFPDGATEFSLPLASRDWGERYMQRIEYY